MLNISETEARTLLSRPLRCEGDLQWAIARNRPASLKLSVGILDGSGAATGMEAELSYRSDASTATKYLFSVRMRRSYGMTRVYQLEVIHALRATKDLHAQSHEHFGDRRFNGQAAGRIGDMMKFWLISALDPISLSTRPLLIRLIFGVRGSHELRIDIQNDRIHLPSSD